VLHAAGMMMMMMMTMTTTLHYNVHGSDEDSQSYGPTTSQSVLQQPVACWHETDTVPKYI